MKKTSVTLTATAIAALIAACTATPTDEQQGSQMLQEARTLLRQGNTAAARDTILSLRRRFPRAVQARRQAILTLDSIELQDARNQADSLKIEFYERKIADDLTK